MEQYRVFAECFLPEHMLDWFELKNVVVEKKDDDVKVIHLYLDENGMQFRSGKYPLLYGACGFFKRSVWRRSL